MAISFTTFCVIHVLAMLCVCHVSCMQTWICPQLCSCWSGNGTALGLDCLLTNERDWNQTCAQLNSLYTENGSMPDLKFRQQSGDWFFPDLSCLLAVNSIAFTHASLLTNIASYFFQHLHIASGLDLSLNNITLISDEAFISLDTIKTLNLSNNLIFSLNNNSFKGLSSLKSLDLSYNRLITINVTTFSELKNLVRLDLSFNRLVLFSSLHLPNSLNLRILILKGNYLKRVDNLDMTNSSVSAINLVSALDISDNPLDCSCTLDYLFKSLPLHLKSLQNSRSTVCKSPTDLKGLTILSLNNSALTCSSPKNIISYPSHETNAVFRETLRLECRSDGYPAPSIFWITPWGEVFSYSQPSLIHQSGFTAQSINTLTQYEEKNIDIVTTISVNEKNDLTISQFRGSLSGNFTCVAFNIAGNKSETIDLSITSKLKSVYVKSLFIASYTASGLLIFGFLVGFIKMNIVRLSHKHWFNVPIVSTTSSIRPVSSSCRDPTVSGKDDTNFSDSSSSCIIEGATADSSSKDLTYNLNGSPAEKRPLYIIESLEDAKDRLRFGVGRKVESMKRNVQSIKHTSSAAVQTIRESGSSAASRIAASMATGVETVKSHVQSFKELCGTGDMGFQTISTMSVETDIDTNEQTNIIRQITYV